jgi:hypothetical protein
MEFLKISSLFSYFLLEQKVTKIQGFTKIGCVSNPEVSPRNTRHEIWHKTLRLSLLCIATHKPFAHTSVKNRYPIFLMPVPSKIVSSFGNIAEQRFGSLGNADTELVEVQGVGTGLR